MKPFMGGLLFLALVSAGAEELLRQEIPSRFAPAELLQPAIKKQLSPQGRFVILPEKGSVLVIDRAAHVFAAAEAVESLDIPPPQVQLGLGLETGGQVRAPGSGGGNPRVLGPVESFGFAPFPTAFNPPRIVGRGNGAIVLPAHPTGFTYRKVGQSLETRPTLNSDGSITLDINAENVEFLGFINYGSPIFPSGTTSVIPVGNGLTNAPAFRPFIPNNINVPIFQTTRVSTSVVVYPNVAGAGVDLHLLPQVTLLNEIDGEEKSVEVSLKQFRSRVSIPNGKVVRLPGFEGAPEDFNELFFAPKDDLDGQTRMVLKANIRPGNMPAENSE